MTCTRRTRWGCHRGRDAGPRWLSPGGICQRSGCLGEWDADACRERVDVESGEVHPLGGLRNALVVESEPMGDVVWRDSCATRLLGPEHASVAWDRASTGTARTDLRRWTPDVVVAQLQAGQPR
jgi:hypothetical protein